jgi:predicted RNA-binding Zn-ribbon protein involved in translation (DUF1610 family)
MDKIMEKEMTINCKSCGERIYVYLPQTIDVKEALKSGGNIKHLCPHCGESYTKEEIERMAK